MVEFLSSRDVLLLLTGALISILVFLAQTLVKIFQTNKGQVKIYTKPVYDKATNEAWGFHFATDGQMYFNVPLWIEIHNTKGKNQIVRNFNLSLYADETLVGKTKQINYSGTASNKEIYGDEGAYSFLISENSIARYKLNFVAFRNDINKNFNKVVISYFDSNDKLCESLLFDVEEPWKISDNKADYEWSLMKKGY